ncbi:MAG TPA: thymidine phosphorylase, partial [Actinoplanes sp.]|nr:thymidine phosphorylase [Actinoplanes sp.]
TGTVESIPLIASSIMSKKIAEGAGALVLDVKVGSGAFMKDLAAARELAATMVQLGAAHGVRTVAMLTDMSTPLGHAVGNAVEVTESLAVLAGGGPPDVVELTLLLAREMLDAAGLPHADPGKALASGAAMDCWRSMIRAQGGDPDAPLPVAREIETVRADRAGVIAAVDAYRIGSAAWRLGAGRARQGDPVSPAAGVMLRARPGDRVVPGDPLFELRTDDGARIPAALAVVAGAVTVADVAPRPRPLLLGRIDQAGR